LPRVIPVETTALECCLPQKGEIEYQPFYIDSPLVRALDLFDERLYKCKTYTRRIA
jgi:hypothetical protein